MASLLTLSTRIYWFGSWFSVDEWVTYHIGMWIVKFTFNVETH